MHRILKLLKASFDFKKPTKKKIIIFDRVGSEIIQTYFKNEITIMEVRLEKINIFILIKTLFNLKFNKTILQNYIENFIYYVNPKIVITHIDNNDFFFKLKKTFPKIKFIALQNGIGLTSFTKGQLSSKDWHTDYFFVYSNAYKLIYERFVKGKIINIGSFINNHIKKSLEKKSERQIVYISQFREGKPNNKNFYNFENKYFTHDDFLLAEKKVVEYLSRYCEKKKIKLCIAGIYGNGIKKEKIFYEEIINKISKKIIWEFKPRVKKWDSYNLIDSAQLVVFVDSALGYQSLARKNKTVSFSIRSQYLKNPQLKFGWPSRLNDDGPFWCNTFEEIKFDKILNNLINLTKKDWERLLDKYETKLLNYDFNNSKFKKILEGIK